MVKNRDAKHPYKFKTRQVKIAGKLPFHRVYKMQKLLGHLISIKRRKS